MKAPKILPWIARKNGISEQLALGLWRRAAGETEELTGDCDSSDYYFLAVGRFLDLAEEEGEKCAERAPVGALSLVPRIGWLLRHQNRMLQLNLFAAKKSYIFWLANWRALVFGQKPAVYKL